MLSEAVIRGLEEKYKGLPDRERIQKYDAPVRALRIQEEEEKLLAKYVFSGKIEGLGVDVLQQGEHLKSKEDFVQLARSVCLVMKNSGKEQLIPAFFEECLASCKSCLSYDQTKVPFGPSSADHKRCCQSNRQ